MTTTDRTPHETYAILICIDCGQLVANGEYPPDFTMDECQAMVDAIEHNWPPADGWHIVPGDSLDDHDFSWSTCDACQSPLGGYRYAAHAMRRTA